MNSDDRIDADDELMWLDDTQWVTLTELTVCSGLTESELTELVEYGALAPAAEEGGQWRFAAHCVTIARRACRLRNELDLDAHAVAVVLGYLERIRELEAQVRELQARLPRGRR
ncbi:MAG TPA: chaperone modulator CbpM [Burkholderiaceae bacterium]|jgi:chaperone modulatory protein CbpM|nr:chaperone modulator CbpM [Burkholderiaceae bacterium]